MNAGLTTHVLDTTSEGPADGVEVTLQRIGPDGDVEPMLAPTRRDRGLPATLRGRRLLPGGTDRLDVLGDGSGAVRHRRHRRALSRPPAGVSRRVHDPPWELPYRRRRRGQPRSRTGPGATARASGSRRWLPGRPTSGPRRNTITDATARSQRLPSPETDRTARRPIRDRTTHPVRPWYRRGG